MLRRQSLIKPRAELIKSISLDLSFRHDMERPLEPGFWYVAIKWHSSVPVSTWPTVPLSSRDALWAVVLTNRSPVPALRADFDSAMVPARRLAERSRSSGSELYRSKDQA